MSTPAPKVLLSPCPSPGSDDIYRAKFHLPCHPYPAKLPMKSPTRNRTLYFLFFFFSYLRFTNANNIFLNCGSSRNYSIGLDGHKWTGDSGTGSKFLASEQSNESSIVSKSINLHSSLDPVPYLTARIFQSPFTYSFSVSPGQKFVRLYFNPTTYQGFRRSTAVFTVTAGPFTLLRHFSPSLTADSLGLKTLVKEFCLNIEENQILNITFSPSSTPLGTYAFINGIKIVSSPLIFITGTRELDVYMALPCEIGLLLKTIQPWK